MGVARLGAKFVGSNFVQGMTVCRLLCVELSYGVETLRRADPHLGSPIKYLTDS
jgi:hypothetical protein